MYSEIAANKHFHIIPKPIFEYLCSLDITRAQQNVFIFLYGEAHITKTPFTEIATKTISKRLCISMSTVKRAFTALSDAGLIVRHGQGRCRFNPMRSAISKTEITIPTELKERLQASPDRKESIEPVTKTVKTTVSKKTTAKSYIALHDEDEDDSAPQNTASEQSVVSVVNDALGLTRQISMGYAVKLRELLKSLVDEKKLQAFCNEVLWSLEQGSLAPYPLTKGRNIALKLIRQRRWSAPKDMPAHWQWNPA